MEKLVKQPCDSQRVCLYFFINFLILEEVHEEDWCIGIEVVDGNSETHALFYQL